MELHALYYTVLRHFEYFCYITLPVLSEQPVFTYNAGNLATWSADGSYTGLCLWGTLRPKPNKLPFGA